MTYDNTWNFQLNVEPIDQTTLQKQCQSWFIQLKLFLIDAGWTVESSSNGTIYSANSDLWNADLININWDNSSLARSWILLKSPVGIVAGANGSYLGDQSRVWLLLDCHGNSNTDYGKWSVYFHRVKPSGIASITTIPSSVNGITLISNTTFVRATLTNCKWQFAHTSNGNFYALVTLNGLLIMHTALILYPISDVGKYQGHDYPYAIGAQVSTLDTTDHMNFYLNASYALTSVVNAVFNTWMPDGTKTAAIIWTMVKASAYTTSAFPEGEGIYGSYYFGYKLSGGGDSEGNQWLFNVYLTAETTTLKYIIGKVSDIKFCGNQNVINTTVDSTGVNPTYCNFRNVWFPVNTRFLA